MLDRLHALHKQACSEKTHENGSSSNCSITRPFAHLAKERKDNLGYFYYLNTKSICLRC